MCSNLKWSQIFLTLKVKSVKCLFPTRYHLSTIHQNETKKYNSKESVPNYKVVFIGSDEFSIPSLIKLTQLLGNYNVSVVVSNYNNLVGKYAKKNGLQTFHWDEYKTDEFCKDKSLVEELGVVASFGYLIPQKVIQRFPLGILNVHASLLPRWRGAAPIAHAIMHGDTVTGVSIMQIAPHKFDVGPVLHQVKVPLHPHIKRPELTTIMAHAGADALANVIKNLDDFLKNPMPQDEAKATFSPKLSPEMAEFDWNTKTNLESYNLFRGLYGVYKLKTNFLDKKVDLDEISLVSEGNQSVSQVCDKAAQEKLNITDSNAYTEAVYILKDPKMFSFSCNAIPGQIFFKHDLLFVKCTQLSNPNFNEYLPYISIRKVKLGNKWMSAKDFQNGFLSKCKPEQRLFWYNNVVSQAVSNAQSKKINR